MFKISVNYTHTLKTTRDTTMTTLIAALNKLKKNGFTVTTQENDVAVFYSFTKPELTRKGSFLVTKHENDDVDCLQLLFKNGEFPSYYYSFNKLFRAVLLSQQPDFPLE